MKEVSEHFSHLQQIRNRNTDPWFHPSSLADAFTKKVNDTEEATKLYNTHANILKQKLKSIQKVFNLVITPSIEPTDTPLDY